MAKQIFVAGLWLVVLISQPALAQTPTATATPIGGVYIPAPPFVAITDQGRAMVGAGVTITDIFGGDVSGQVKGNRAGSSSYSYTVPASGIVQFYALPDNYIVTVAGSGLTRQYQVTIPESTSGGGGGGITINDLTNDDFVFIADDEGSDFNITTAAPNEIHINLPDASVTDRGAVTTQAQSFAGIKTFTEGVTVNQIIVNNAQDNAIPMQVKTQTFANAIYVNGTTDQIGFFTSNPELTTGGLAISAPAGLDGINLAASAGGNGIVITAGGSGTAYGLKSTISAVSGGAAVYGIASDGDALAGLFERSTSSGTVPVFKVTRNNTTDNTKLLELVDAGATTAANHIFSYTLNGTMKFSMASDGMIYGTQQNLLTPTFSFIGDGDTGVANSPSAGEVCLVDEAINGICVLGNGADTQTSAAGSIFITAGATANPSLKILAIANSGPEIEVNSTEFVLTNGELSVGGISGDGTGKAVCIKAGGTLGTCTDAVGGGGTCTCA